MGCLHEFDHRITHSIESDQMAGYQEFSQTGTDSLPQSYLAYFAQIAPLGDYFIAALPHEGYDPDAFAVTSNTPTQQIEQGTIIDVGHKAFGVLPLTGHSAALASGINRLPLCFRATRFMTGCFLTTCPTVTSPITSIP